MTVVHSLWHGPPLSALEIACFRSWTAQGYKHQLWTYDSGISGVPPGTCVRNAAEVLDPSWIFSYQAGDFGVGSFSGFSNFFRYKALLEFGVIWAEADMYCLKSLPLQPYLFVSEGTTTATCVFAVPPASQVMRECWEACQQMDVKTLRWAQSGPFLLHEKIIQCNLEQHIQPPHKYLPVLWKQAGRLMSAPELDLSGCYGVHFWHQQLIEQGFEPDGHYSGSTHERLIHA